MAKEYAEVIDHDVESITCVCGNTCSDEGLPQCNEDGVVYYLSQCDVPAGLAEMPEEPEKYFTLCRACGRVYEDRMIERYDIAPVHKTVDIKEGPVAESLRVHDEVQA